MQSLRLKDKAAIVTGGGIGIGRGICRALAAEGANVVVADINGETAQQTCDILSDFGGRYLPIRIDVTVESEVERMVEETVRNLGRVDILCANAGVSTMNLVVDLTEGEWDRNMNVNAKGIFLCCKHVARQMIKQGKGGKIINTASIGGKHGSRFLAHYCASKFAVVGFTMSLADELAPHRINVNAVCPGLVATSMQEREVQWEAKLRGTTPERVRQRYIDATPLGRLEEPEDVAKLVVFLASTESDFMTGQSINIDGGIEKR